MSGTHTPPHHGQHDAMLKFIIAGRRKRADTQERYFYEWGNIHVALMVTTPEVMTFFQRYCQHFTVTDVRSEDLPLPLSAMEWDNMADHWVASYDDMLRSVKHPDYVARMQPHKFGDDAFNLVLMSGKVLHQAPGFVSGKGGVKLLLWAKAPQGAGEDFAETWKRDVADALLTSPAAGRIRKYIHNRPREIDPALFAGSLFARGGVNEFALLDELWLDSVSDLKALSKEPVLVEAMKRLGSHPDSFSMVTTERVIYDYVTPGEISPRPACDRPDSLEARIASQGFSNWNVPKLPLG